MTNARSCHPRNSSSLKHHRCHFYRCKHYRRSHSYRCLRSAVMRHAGPTKSQLALFRTKVYNILAPPFLRNLLITAPAITSTKACGNSTIAEERFAIASHDTTFTDKTPKTTTTITSKKLSSNS
ncbi:uncharacterized protein LOC113238982 isoform X1 [Hyposmocoma kahamanoa]|nr:uncharacterized protein LOC113238982 isoform X1 [Hyposmocoma kahamanoa]